MKKENVVDRESAEAEFDRFAECMDLDINTTRMDPEDATAFNKTKDRLIKAVQQGSLVFNEDGEAVYTPSHPKSKHDKPITFHERTGASLMAMDSKKKGHDVAKTYAVLANMCEVHPSTFANLVGIDVKICEAIFALLMD